MTAAPSPEEVLAYYRANAGPDVAEAVAEFREMDPKDRDELLMHMMQNVSRLVRRVAVATDEDAGVSNLATGIPKQRSDA